MTVRPVRRPGAVLWAVLLASALLAACSSDKPKPTPLQPLTPSIAGKQVWSADIGDVRFQLGVPVRDGKIFVADSGGTVLALQADSGAEVWRAQAGATLSAGVGSDGRYASVVTVDNEVLVFDAGKLLWRQRVPSRVVTPPLVAGERVFVKSVDRVVHAFDVLDGRRLWTLQRPGDALTLSQAGVVAAYKNTLLVGQGARLAALDPLRGTLQWEVPMASPRGTNEVERLADLLGPALRLGDKVCARAFQSAVACADAARGALLWSRNAGGTQAVGGSEEIVVGADGADRITAWKTATGEVLWGNERLLYRQLSGMLVVGPTVVFGDVDGYVHFLSAASGEPQLRLPTDGEPVIATPVLAGTTVVVATRKGGIFAFRPN
ncbi:outer membrane protein assembly factor BamB [Rubrivivax sp. RP6-9]|uniref:outer membrane protein assembly factor BamB n=1 Tax=Rubrivivax sp. RP6-9 TaxID=3415750 RepID=UPI003CC6ABF0